jgi:hypothetical protein
MLAKLAILFLITPSSADVSPIDSKKAKQLVNSVFGEENKTKLQEVEKNKLNGTDNAVFLKQYHSDDMQEIANAGVVAEKYDEISFNALAEMLKSSAPAPGKGTPASVHAAVQASKQKRHFRRVHPRQHDQPKPEAQPVSEPKTVNAAPKTFIDLGSGVGRAVLFACASGEFTSCEGVELSESRHKMAVDALAKFKHLSPGTAKKVSFVNGNLLADDAYFKKDVMLLDNNFLSEGVMENFVRKFEHVAPSGTVLLTTKRVPQLSDRIAERTRIAVEGEKGHRELFFKYIRT